MNKQKISDKVSIWWISDKQKKIIIINGKINESIKSIKASRS